MIEGLKIEIKSEELKKHLVERAGYHEKRSAFYYKQAAEFRKSAEKESKERVDILEEEATPMVSNRTMVSQEANLIGTAKNHRDKAAYFKFLADHVVPNETYRVSEEDLGRLEILTRYM